MRRALEEERHRNLQDMRDVLQTARTDAVGALLVFLHLLEGDLERLAKLLLAHAEHLATHPQSAAHMLVDRVGELLGHCLSCDGILFRHPTALFGEMDAALRWKSRPIQHTATRW